MAENDIRSENKSGTGDESERDVVLDPKIQELIGRSLKAHYDDLVRAPVPDKFLVLLAELEAREQGYVR
jgi:Anti-sigma factor NepR